MKEEHLRVLGELNTSKTRQELASKLDYSPKTITNALGELSKEGLITRDSSGRETVVEPVAARCVEVYQSLSSSHPHIDFPDLLTGSMLKLLYHVSSDDWKSAATIIDESGHPKSTVYRHLKTLRNRAIVLKERRSYRLADEFELLHVFATELQHHRHRHRVRREIGEGNILWEADDEFLVQTVEPIPKEGYHQTGIDAFAEYGLDFLTTAEHYYFYSPTRSSLTPADLVCHLLVIENDARHRKYAMLLLAAVGQSRETVEDRASYYGVDDVVTAMKAYLESRGEQRTDELPPWEQFESLAAEYGVTL
ncbi:transcriptional regulator TrmB [Haloarculaceae archaeon H-GB2-1]|nr:transcriptional regulator TrmB [Haloarculaceae archaeon H-GB1-1]MEA5407002.1 transcriptional regulator TrmB [Haloarculaceae archaeon H-GB2-1]